MLQMNFPETNGYWPGHKQEHMGLIVLREELWFSVLRNWKGNGIEMEEENIEVNEKYFQKENNWLKKEKRGEKEENYFERET